ncbi:MAG: DUF1700 domain-containing protein [Candidatus Izimaplasma sp.]|nr:DUF1700 domain-containing protein [Candidatus Izimaplasma bacterium]
MNKLEFLNALNKELDVLDKEERKEIIAFYEERFHTGTIYENRTEEEILAELESPQKIAKNVLEEYGVSKKYVKDKSERYTNVNGASVVMVLLFDLFIATWLIPTLYTIVISIFGSMLSYVSVIPLILGERTFYDEFMFAFFTAAYVLLLLFAFVVLEAALYVTKKIVIWHLNVFKLKKRDKYIRGLSKLSVDRWFKRHRLIKSVKNIALVGAIVTIVYTGIWLFGNQEEVMAYYQYNELQIDTYELDVSDDIVNQEEWTVATDLQWMKINVVLSDDESIHIYHQYNKTTDFTATIDDNTNQIIITEARNNDWFTWEVTSLIDLLGMKKELRIEVPQSLLLDDITIENVSGDLNINNIETNDLEVALVNGSISLQYVTVTNNVTIQNTNGDITVLDTTSSNMGVLDINNTNGRISTKRVTFGSYEIDNDNGDIVMINVNTDAQDGISLTCDVVNGDVELSNVYVNIITCESTNGNIDLFNEDTSFIPDQFDADTTNGNVSAYFPQ